MTRPDTQKKVLAFHRSHPSATAGEVAAALNVGEAYVRSTGYRNGIEFASARGEFVYVPKKVASKLDEYALERGLTVNELSKQLLSAIAMDGLVGAILDEG